MANFTLIQEGGLEGRGYLLEMGAERAGESQRMPPFLSLVTGVNGGVTG